MPKPEVFRTHLEDVEIWDGGMSSPIVLLRSEGGGSFRVSLLPLRDRRTGLSAQLTARAAIVATSTLGGRLPTFGEVSAIDRVGYRLAPVVLPDLEQRAAVPRRKGEDSKAYERRVRRDMASFAWLERHDLRVLEQFRKSAWNGTDPVANFGKLWIGPTPPGTGKIRGWSDGRGGWIQRGLRPQHDDLHCDYATKTYLVIS